MQVKTFIGSVFGIGHRALIAVAVGVVGLVHGVELVSAYTADGPTALVAVAWTAGAVLSGQPVRTEWSLRVDNFVEHDLVARELVVGRVRLERCNGASMRVGGLLEREVGRFFGGA